MNTIWKYALNPGQTTDVDMPRNAVPLCVKVQRDQVSLWAMVNPDFSMESRRFRVCVTGGNAPDAGHPGRYIGTFLTDDDTFVGHVFEELIA